MDLRISISDLVDFLSCYLQNQSITSFTSTIHQCQAQIENWHSPDLHLTFTWPPDHNQIFPWPSPDPDLTLIRRLWNHVSACVLRFHLLAVSSTCTPPVALKAQRAQILLVLNTPWVSMVQTGSITFVRIDLSLCGDLGVVTLLSFLWPWLNQKKSNYILAIVPFLWD